MTVRELDKVVDEFEDLSNPTSDESDSQSESEHGDNEQGLDECLLRVERVIDDLYKLNTKSKPEEQDVSSLDHNSSLYRESAIRFIRHIRSESGHHTQVNDANDEALYDQLAQSISKRSRRFRIWAGQAGMPNVEVETADTAQGSRSRHSRTNPIAHISTSVMEAVPNSAISPTLSAIPKWPLSLPMAPTLVKYQTVFQCPYCYVWCSKTDAGLRIWR